MNIIRRGIKWLRAVDWRYAIPVAFATAFVLFVVLPPPVWAQTGPTPLQQILYTVLSVALSVFVGVIGTEVTKGIAFINNLGGPAVAVFAALYGWVAQLVVSQFGFQLPTDFNQLTGANVAGLITMFAALVLHINQRLTARRIRRGLTH